jgi:phosphoribosylamine--glycine ligase
MTTRESEASYVIHAGTKRNSTGAFSTNGGRVLNVVGYSDRGLKTALELAYSAAEAITWSGRQIRRDIGRSVLDRKT